MPLFGKAATADDPGDVSPEVQLIRRVREGDDTAFAELYRKYAPTVNGVVLARVPRDDVQDIVQEVFISAFRKLNTLRDERLFGPWIVKIARNHSSNFYRSTRITEELNENLNGPDKRSAQAAEALRAIRSLSGAYSETLMLRLVEGMTAKEIAERTGLKPESVRVNLHRGMEMLRKRLGISEVQK